jgi:hypothetical protein
MPDNHGLQRVQHLPLGIEIVLKKALVGPSGNGARFDVHGPVVIDRYLMHVMHGANEEIRPRKAQELAHQARRGRPDPLALEADEDVDAAAVLVAQPQRFFNVGVVAGPQLADGMACF